MLGFTKISLSNCNGEFYNRQVSKHICGKNVYKLNAHRKMQWLLGARLIIFFLNFNKN